MKSEVAIMEKRVHIDTWKVLQENVHPPSYVTCLDAWKQHKIGYRVSVKIRRCY